MKERTSIVEMVGITKSFLHQVVNEDVDFNLYPGEVHALLGENGAGKTTLMNMLTGVYFQDKGKIIWKDKEIRFSFPGESLKNGIGMVHQRFSLIERMTILENIILGLKGTPFWLNLAHIEKRVQLLADQYNFRFNWNRPVSELHAGDRQKVEILKMLIRNVDCLIMDEPTSVLTKQESDQLMKILRAIVDQQKGVVFISHKMNEVMEIADRITVLRKGKRVATVNKSDVTVNELANMMVGKVIVSQFTKTDNPRNVPSLEVQNLNVICHKVKAIKNLQFNVYKGEVLGIAGVSGNGQKELADTIAGVLKPTTGRIILNGVDITHKSIKSRLKLGFGYIPENRTQVGTAGQTSIWENLIMRIYDKKEYHKAGLLNIPKLKQYAHKIIDKYDIASPGFQYPSAVLSGGNLQKLIVGREIEAVNEFYIFIHPSRGLDVSATFFMRTQIQELRNQGKAILLISGDLDELFELSDRIAVMYEGQFMDILEHSEYDVEHIGLLMSGIKEGQPISQQGAITCAECDQEL